MSMKRCDAEPACDNGDWTIHCDRYVGHTGPHAAALTYQDAKPEPAPVPEWRRLVDDARDDASGYGVPLADVLACLTDMAHCVTSSGDPGPEYDCLLARIVAVCEQQVGDGWQADPDVEVVGSAWVLMTMFTDHDPRYEIGLAPAAARWMNLGNYAAAWLRDLTEATE